MFYKQKTAVFLVMPKEDNTKYFIISLVLQQLYRGILVVADENGWKLDNSVVLYWDELGTIPKIESVEMIFFATSSRRLNIVPMIQSFAQLNKSYGKEGAAIVIDNCQDMICLPIWNTQRCCPRALATRQSYLAPSAVGKE